MSLIKERGKNTGNRLLLTVIIAGYAFFLTTKLWLPDVKELVDATPLYEKQVSGDYSIYLTKWEYAQKDQSMEIIVETETTNLLAARLECEAVERTAGELHTKTLISDREYQVIQITDIPQNWKEISLRMIDDKGEYLSLYTNIDAVEQVEALKEKSEDGYLADRIQGQIEYDAYRIRKKEQEISDLTAENRSLENGIDEMMSKQYPTQEEADKAAELIKSAEKKCEVNDSTIETRKTEISELELRTEELKKQIEELK